MIGIGTTTNSNNSTGRRWNLDMHTLRVSEGVLEEAGLSFAKNRPLYEACKDSIPLKSRNHAVWWKQVHFSQNDENEIVND